MAFPRSQRTTREWPLLMLALAIVCAICIPLYQWSASKGVSDPGLSRWTPERLARLLLGPEQIAAYCAATWAGFILLSRYLEVRRQKRAFGLELLPPGQCILVEDARDLHRASTTAAAPPGRSTSANLPRPRWARSPPAGPAATWPTWSAPRARWTSAG